MNDKVDFVEINFVKTKVFLKNDVITASVLPETPQT